MTTDCCDLELWFELFTGSMLHWAGVRILYVNISTRCDVATYNLSKAICKCTSIKKRVNEGIENGVLGACTEIPIGIMDES